MSRDPKYQKLLNSPRWKQLRASYLREHPLCERCEAENHIASAIDVHHKVPVESANTLWDMERLAYDWNNLQALCIPCHVKTHKEMGKDKKENVLKRKELRLQRWMERVMTKAEEWRPINGTNGKYEVSNKGRVKTLRQRPGMVKITKQKSGYLYAMIEVDGKSKNCRVNRLVAQHFIPNPDNLPEVNHIDGNKENNYVNNLEWCTRSHNVLHSFDTGLRQPHRWTDEEKKHISDKVKSTLRAKTDNKPSGPHFFLNRS